jgi:hypothetical protein
MEEYKSGDKTIYVTDRIEFGNLPRTLMGYEVITKNERFYVELTKQNER